MITIAVSPVDPYTGYQCITIAPQSFRNLAAMLIAAGDAANPTVNVLPEKAAKSTVLMADALTHELLAHPFKEEA